MLQRPEFERRSTQIARRTRGAFGAVLAFALASCEGAPIAPSAAAVDVPPSLREEIAPVAERVRLDEQQRAQLDVRTEPVRQARLPYILSVPGEVSPSPKHFAIVSAPIGGRIVAVYAHEGEVVRRGEALLELESLEYAGLVADVLRARAERNYQQSQVDRLLQLVAKKIAAQQSLEKAQADLLRARAEFDAAFARVSALGLTEDGLETAGPTLVLRAPIAGAIDRHEIDLGSAVTVYQEMLSIVDPSHVLVQAYVPPDEAGDVAPGDTVSIHGSDAGQAALAARIATVNPALGAENRSVVANILTPTRGGWPRPGQAVQVTIAGLGAIETLSVPLSAILYEGDRATAFVQLDDASYEQRPVVLGRLTADRAEVLEGLHAGEPVAVTQVFNLKALRRFDQFGEE